MPVELLYSVNIINKMLWVGIVNQGTYTSVTDLCTQKTILLSQQVQAMDMEKPTIQLVTLPKG